MLGAPFEQAEVAEWEQMINVNVRGLIRTGRVFIDDLLAAAEARRRADLIPTSALLAATSRSSNYGVYCATKAAVAHLTRSLRKELGPRGVRVKNVEPGVVATELGDGMRDETGRAMLAEMRTQITTLEAGDIADAIAFAAAAPPAHECRRATSSSRRREPGPHSASLCARPLVGPAPLHAVVDHERVLPWSWICSTSTRTIATRSAPRSTTARPTAVSARLPAASTVTAQRGSSRSRASDSRRSASASASSRGPRRTAVETGIACGSPAPVESTATVPSGHVRQLVHAARLRERAAQFSAPATRVRT